MEAGSPRESSLKTSGKKDYGTQKSCMSGEAIVEKTGREGKQ
jgi:hypothetical protein